MKLIDFDAARILKPAADKDTVFVGTDGFAPPEQYGFTQTDQLSDIYALGITMKVLLGEDYQHSRYRRIIEKCTRFSPEYRYKSMAKVRHAVILSRYSGAIIGASAGLAAAICFVVILAGFPHKSVPEMVSSVPPEITSSVSTAVQTTGSSKAVTEPATTAPTTSSSQQTISVEPVTPTVEPVEITEQAPAPEPIIPATSASSSSAVSSATTSTKATTNSTLPTTTTTSTEPQKPVEIPSEISIPEDSVRPYNWENLPLPEGFPKLADAVTEFNSSDTTMVISWDFATREEADKMAALINEWNGGKELLPDEKHEPLSWYWFDVKPYSVDVSYYSETEHLDGRKQLSVSVLTNYKYEPFIVKYSGVSNYSVPENSERPYSMSEIGLPEDFPELPCNVTDYVDTTNQYSEYRYEIQWDKMSFEETAALADILAKRYNYDNYTVEFSKPLSSWEVLCDEGCFRLTRWSDERDVSYQVSLDVSRQK